MQLRPMLLVVYVLALLLSPQFSFMIFPQANASSEFQISLWKLYGDLIGSTDNPPANAISLGTAMQARADFTESVTDIHGIILKLINPLGEVVDRTAGACRPPCPSSVPETLDFTANIPGTWTVKAIFINDPDLIDKHIDILTYPESGPTVSAALSLNFTVDILVVPESPIGIIALMGSSLAALGGFMYFRQYRNKVNI